MVEIAISLTFMQLYSYLYPWLYLLTTFEAESEFRFWADFYTLGDVPNVFIEIGIQAALFK